MLDEFYKNRTKFKYFLIQINLYIRFNNTKFILDTEKVLWIIIFFRGTTLEWVEGFFIDYLINHIDGKIIIIICKKIKNIFQILNKLKIKLNKIFNNIDETKKAI